MEDLNQIIIEEFERVIKVVQRYKELEYSTFICIIIKQEEALKYFEENRPSETLHKKFYNHDMYVKPADYPNSVWWLVYSHTGNKGTTTIKHCQRELFLEHLIKQLKKEK